MIDQAGHWLFAKLAALPWPLRNSPLEKGLSAKPLIDQNRTDDCSWYGKYM